MIRMKIGLNVGKIHKAHYDLAAMQRTIESVFESTGLQKSSTGNGDIVYQGTGSTRDFGRFGKVVNALKKQPWFMNNISSWRMYNSDDSDEFNEEDLLQHYRNQGFLRF